MASFNISNFRSQVSSLARPNLFMAKFANLPSVFSKTSYGIESVNETFEFRCERAELPGKSIATIDDVHSGSTTKLAYDLVYNDITLTIIATNDMKDRVFFETWMDNIVVRGGQDNYGAGGLVSYYDSYASNSILELFQLREDGSAAAKYTLYDIYPIQLSPMTLAWEEINTYQRFTVTMSYRYHVMTDENENPTVV